MAQYKLNLDDVVDAQITTEANSTNMDAKSNIIRNALGTYLYLRKQIKSGNSVVIMNADGQALGRLDV